MTWLARRSLGRTRMRAQPRHLALMACLWTGPQDSPTPPPPLSPVEADDATEQRWVDALERRPWSDAALAGWIKHHEDLGTLTALTLALEPAAREGSVVHAWWLAHAEKRWGHHASAKQWLERAARGAPDGRPDRLLATWAMETQSWPEATRAFERAIERGLPVAERLQSLLALARLHLRQDDAPRAQRMLDTVSQDPAADASTHADIARLWEEADRTDEAMVVWRNLEEEADPAMRVRSLRAQARIHAERHDEDAVEECLDRLHDAVDVHGWRGRVLWSDGASLLSNSRWIACLKRWSANSSNAATVRALAHAQRDIGALSAALDVIRGALARWPGDRELHLLFIETQAATGAYADAERAAAEATRLFPDDARLLDTVLEVTLMAARADSEWLPAVQDALDAIAHHDPITASGALHAARQARRASKTLGDPEALLTMWRTLFETAIARDPDDVDLSLAYASALAADHLDEAAGQTLRGLKARRDPSDLERAAQRADELLYTDIRDDLQKEAIALAPHRTDLRERLVTWLMESVTPDTEAISRHLDALEGVALDTAALGRALQLRVDLAERARTLAVQLTLWEKEESTRGRWLCALALDRQGQRDSARAAYAHLLEGTPDALSARQRHAELVIEHDLADGFRAYRALMQQSPERSAEWLYCMADAALRQRELHAAHDASTELLERRPADRDASLLLARVLREQKNPGKAVRVLRRAVRLHPDDALVRGQFGDALMDTGLVLDAVPQWIRQLDGTPEAERRRLVVERARTVDASNAADAWFESLSRWAQQQTGESAQRLLAESLSSSGRFERAADVLHALLEHSPDAEAVLLQLAELWRTHQPERALPALERLAALRSSEALCARITRIEMRVGSAGAAERVWKQWLSTLPEESHLELIETWWSTHREPDIAVAIAAAALQLGTPFDTSACLRYGLRARRLRPSCATDFLLRASLNEAPPPTAQPDDSDAPRWVATDGFERLGPMRRAEQMVEVQAHHGTLRVRMWANDTHPWTTFESGSVDHRSAWPDVGWFQVISILRTRWQQVTTSSDVVPLTDAERSLLSLVGLMDHAYDTAKRQFGPTESCPPQRWTRWLLAELILLDGRGVRHDLMPDSVAPDLHAVAALLEADALGPVDVPPLIARRVAAASHLLGQLAPEQGAQLVQALAVRGEHIVPRADVQRLRAQLPLDHHGRVAIPDATPPLADLSLPSASSQQLRGALWAASLQPDLDPERFAAAFAASLPHSRAGRREPVTGLHAVRERDGGFRLAWFTFPRPLAGVDSFHVALLEQALHASDAVGTALDRLFAAQPPTAATEVVRLHLRWWQGQRAEIPQWLEQKAREADDPTPWLISRTFALFELNRFRDARSAARTLAQQASNQRDATALLLQHTLPAWLDSLTRDRTLYGTDAQILAGLLDHLQDSSASLTHLFPRPSQWLNRFHDRKAFKDALAVDRVIGLFLQSEELTAASTRGSIVVRDVVDILRSADRVTLDRLEALASAHAGTGSDPVALQLLIALMLEKDDEAQRLFTEWVSRRSEEPFDDRDSQERLLLHAIPGDSGLMQELQAHRLEQLTARLRNANLERIMEETKSLFPLLLDRREHVDRLLAIWFPEASRAAEDERDARNQRVVWILNDIEPAVRSAAVQALLESHLRRAHRSSDLLTFEAAARSLWSCQRTTQSDADRSAFCETLADVWFPNGEEGVPMPSSEYDSLLSFTWACTPRPQLEQWRQRWESHPHASHPTMLHLRLRVAEQLGHEHREALERALKASPPQPSDGASVND